MLAERRTWNTSGLVAASSRTIAIPAMRTPAMSLRILNIDPLPLRIDHGLEAAVDHSPGVERHGFWIHHLREALVLHHLGEDAVAILAHLVDDVGEHHGLAPLEFHAARKRRPSSHFD